MLRFLALALCLAASASFTAPVGLHSRTSTIRITMQHGGKGFGGGEATRDPEPSYVDPNDPKGKQQAIHKAESFSDYLAKRSGSGSAAAASAPAASPAPTPKQSFDNDMSGWKPPSGQSGAHAMGGDASKFTATDTPDFLPEEGSAQDAMAKGISFSDGLMGSRERT